MEILICDNNSQTLSFLEALLSNHYKSIHQIFTFSNADELMKYEGKPDLLLSDIKLEDTNGIDVCRDFLEKHPNVKIVFVTGYPAEYYQEIFDYFRPFGFMSKPIQEDLLFKRIDNIERIIQNDQRIKFICKGHSLFLNPNDILFVESNGRRKKITADGNSYIVNISFDEILRMAPNSFLRCHNEFVVNMKHIAKYDNDFIFMTNGSTIPVGRKHRAEFKNRYFAYKEREHIILK